jgi:pilus assembly protein CpaB
LSEEKTMKLPKLPPGSKYFVLAGVIGLAAVFLVHAYIASRTKKTPIVTGQVVVAQTDIAPGTALTGRVLRVATWPRNIIPTKAVSTLKILEGRVVQIPIAKGEPILLTKLALEGTSAGMGGLLDPNCLAITVKTDAVSGVAGFINPGDRVDVLVETTDPGRHNEHFSKLILQNLRVLSKGQIWDQSADKKPKVMPTVTLQVTPEQAEMLNLASFQGRIRLALRNQLNTANFNTHGVDTSELCYIKPAPVAKKVKVAAVSKPERIVQVIKGMETSEARL